MTFIKMEQVNEYITDILFKSLTFKLDEGHILSTSKKKKLGLYFIERSEDKNDTPVYHFIMAKDDSEAGLSCNESVIEQIRKFFMIIKPQPFDAIESLKQNFLDLSKEMLSLEMPIKKENFDNSNNKVIKLNEPKDILLKKILIKELKYPSLQITNFKPFYSYYRIEDKINIKVEIPGNSIFDSSVKYKDDYIIIHMEGIKKEENEPENNKDNIFSNRIFGEFFLDIPIKDKEYIIKNKTPTIFHKNGVFIITYYLEKKNFFVEYQQKDEDI